MKNENFSKAIKLAYYLGTRRQFGSELSDTLMDFINELRWLVKIYNSEMDALNNYRHHPVDKIELYKKEIKDKCLQFDLVVIDTIFYEPTRFPELEVPGRMNTIGKPETYYKVDKEIAKWKRYVRFFINHGNFEITDLIIN